MKQYRVTTITSVYDDFYVDAESAEQAETLVRKIINGEQVDDVLHNGPYQNGSDIHEVELED